MLACQGQHDAEAAELMKPTKRAGALDLQEGTYKRSALHLASTKGMEGTVAKFLLHGANVTLTDKWGKTPPDLAGNDKVKAAFAEHAAKGGPEDHPSE